MQMKFGFFFQIGANDYRPVFNHANSQFNRAHVEAVPMQSTVIIFPIIFTYHFSNIWLYLQRACFHKLLEGTLLSNKQRILIIINTLSLPLISSFGLMFDFEVNTVIPKV